MKIFDSWLNIKKVISTKEKFQKFIIIQIYNEKNVDLVIINHNLIGNQINYKLIDSKENERNVFLKKLV